MSDQKPNLILLTSDQQRGDCLGIDGHPVLQTPNLDMLAAQGTFFRRGYSPCPSCFPARRCLMTGVSAAGQGMVGMWGGDWYPPHTLAGELTRAGYQTELIGKLHLQPKHSRFGFEHMRLADGPHERDSAYFRWLKDVHKRPEEDPGIAHGIDVNGWVGRPTHLSEEQTHTYWCVSQAIEFLEYGRDPKQPFFLNVSLFDPHPPCTPPAFYYDRYIRRELPEPAVGDWADQWESPKRGLRTAAWRISLDREQMRCCQAAYYGTINFVDDQVGRLLQYLALKGLRQRTFILFTSDHGEMLGDHHLFRKCWPYEGSARVPFLAWAPAEMGLPQGVVCEGPVGLQDVLPTLLDVAGKPIPASCTGRSLLPIMRGQQPRVRELYHNEHCGDYEYQDGWHALTDGHSKYVWYSQRPTEHLFELQENPAELHDLARLPDAEARLAPWRQRMVEVLQDRPEGFVQDGGLVLGRPHRHFIPDYQPERFHPYL